MRVLHLQGSLTGEGGTEWHLRAVLEAGMEGVEPVLAVGRPRAPAPRGVPVERVAGLGGRPREQRRAVRGLEALLARWRPALLHLHDVLQPELMDWAARRSGLPAVMTVQDHRSTCPGRGRVLPGGSACRRPPSDQACRDCLPDDSYRAWALERVRARSAALRAFPALVVLSRYMRDELASAGVEPGRVHVIPPFPWGLRPAPAGPPLLLAAGRLVEVKGFHLLLEAYALSGVELPLLLAGEGPRRAELEARARRLGLLPGQGARRVEFAGWLGRGGLSRALARARALVLPSLWQEPFGIAGLEALYRAVPVVASRVGGVEDWLDGESGWLVPPGEVEALSRALEAASGFREARRRGLAGRARVLAHFSPRPLQRRLRALYAALLAGQHPGLDSAPPPGSR